jgi:hypothetical protein
MDPGGGGLVAVDEQGLMQQEPLGRAAAWEPWGGRLSAAPPSR